jgi:DNA replication regulator DPB11
MGGVLTLDLTSDVTHLLVEVGSPPTTTHLTTKYKFVAANREGVRVLIPAWLGDVYRLWVAKKKINMRALERKYKLPIFAGLSVCLTGFEDSKLLVLIDLLLDLQHTERFRSRLEYLITNNGGDYQRDLNKNITHLITNSQEGEKYEHAKQWNIPVVSILWVSDCLRHGMVLEESLYHPARSLEEQVKATLNQEAKVQQGKRLRDGDSHQDEPQKYRRTEDSNPENSRRRSK